MTDDNSKSKPRMTGKGADGAAQKQERLAAALRENLKRRKSRGSAEAIPDESGQEDS